MRCSTGMVWSSAPASGRTVRKGTPMSAGAAPKSSSSATAATVTLTVSDQASRYLLLCEALESTSEAPVIEAFQQLFRHRGLLEAIRSDNGLPFASPDGLYNLSRLSAWWLRLGIQIERIKPGRPQQNGLHERMHLTLKKEATRPPGSSSLQQQAKFDAFRREYKRASQHPSVYVIEENRFC